MGTLVQRLRGHYRIPITDGLGAAGGEEPENSTEFVRTFETSPISREAAGVIEELLIALKAAMAFIDSHVADPDITQQMAENWERLQAAKPYDVIAEASA